MRQTDVLIIGGGPVGLFAAFYCGLRDISVRIVDSLEALGGQLAALYPDKFIYDMPGFPRVLAKDLVEGLAKQALQFKPELSLGQTVKCLSGDAGCFQLETNSGSVFESKLVFIAAGAGAFTPTRLGIPEEESFEGSGLSYGVKRLEDYRGKRAVVVGGGDSAFDWAMMLHGVASEVSIVHRSDRFRAHETSVGRVRELGVPIHTWSTVSGLVGTNRVTGVRVMNSQTKEATVMDCDEVVVNIGFKSSLGPLLNWGLTVEKNQILVDGSMQTNRPGVFAMGDVCTYPNKVKLIATGVGEAATAVCVAKTMLHPGAKLFPGHSSDLDPMEFGSKASGD